MGILHTGKDIRRINEIFGILLKHGFSDIIRRLELTGPLQQAGKLVKTPDKEILELTTSERVRYAMEEAGPAYVKLGQVLATRVDMFPPEWIQEFEKLQDNATQIPFEDMLKQAENALGKPPNLVFRDINPKPLGVASIGQVHRAVTLDGKDVVLKIQKPGIKPKIEADLRIMTLLAKLLADNIPELRRYRPVELVREFERSLMRELDFTIEARNADRIRKNMRKLKWVIIPKVYWKYTSTTLSVQEFIDGIPAKDLKAIEAAGMDRKKFASRGAALAWKMMLEDGFFHADPHPGNFLFLPNHRIAMLDYGMVGKLSDKRREQIIQLMRSIVTQEAELGAVIIESWAEGQPINRDQLASDMEDMVSRYYGLPLSEINVVAVLEETIAMVQQYNIMVPPDIAMLSKACITLEGFGRMLNPNFDIMAEAEPLIRKLLVDRYSPIRLARSVGLRALNFVDQVYTPPPVQHPSTEQQSGIDPRHVERLVARIERSQYRQSQSLLTASGVIGGCILLGGRVVPTIWDISVLGLLMLMGSGAWAGWLFLISRRHLREWE